VFAVCFTLENGLSFIAEVFPSLENLSELERRVGRFELACVVLSALRSGSGDCEIRRGGGKSKLVFGRSSFYGSRTRFET
jgi:hypothetical protein